VKIFFIDGVKCTGEVRKFNPKGGMLEPREAVNNFDHAGQEGGKRREEFEVR
jgi:sRNA-binding regulator protein Hfq